MLPLSTTVCITSIGGRCFSEKTIYAPSLEELIAAIRKADKAEQAREKAEQASMFPDAGSDADSDADSDHTSHWISAFRTIPVGGCITLCTANYGFDGRAMQCPHAVPELEEAYEDFYGLDISYALEHLATVAAFTPCMPCVHVVLVNCHSA
jgi:hypothetical protein